jgi:uncharacterized protein with von Willebrand factor type A (vWA) domain
VICVSDGIASVCAAMQVTWKEERAARKTRAYGILVGTTQGEEVMEQLTDTVFCLDDLRADLPALATIFSI